MAKQEKKIIFLDLDPLLTGRVHANNLNFFYFDAIAMFLYYKNRCGFFEILIIHNFQGLVKVKICTIMKEQNLKITIIFCITLANLSPKQIPAPSKLIVHVVTKFYVKLDAF